MRVSLTKIIVVAAGIIAALCILAGCSSMPQSAISLGDHSSDAQEVVITNNTGKDIGSVVLTASNRKKADEPLSQEGVWADGVTAYLYFPKDDTQTFDLGFTTADGTTYRLCDLNLADIKDALLKLASTSQSCYLEYLSASTGKPMAIIQADQDALSKQLELRKSLKAANKRAETAEKKLAQAEEEIGDLDAQQEATTPEEQTQDQAASSKGDADQNATSNVSSNKGSKASSSTSNSSSSAKKSSSASSSSNKKGSTSSSKKSSSTSSKKSSSSSNKKPSPAPKPKPTPTPDTSGDEQDNACVEL